MLTLFWGDQKFKSGIKRVGKPQGGAGRRDGPKTPSSLYLYGSAYLYFSLYTILIDYYPYHYHYHYHYYYYYYYYYHYYYCTTTIPLLH